MRYTLLYSTALAAFVLIDPCGQRKTFTEQELLASFSGNLVLCQWAQYTKDNADRYVDYDMLPA